MNKKSVPDKWVDAAMKDAAPGCRDDARFYLANAFPTIQEDLLWDLLDADPWVRCACGMDWEVLVSQGPDHGHGRYECPAAADASVTVGGVTVWLYEWKIQQYADHAGQTGRRGITGRIRSYDRKTTGHFVDGPLEATHLPSYLYSPARGQRVSIDVSFDGIHKDPFCIVQWHNGS
jgi:hypothetical protein